MVGPQHIAIGLDYMTPYHCQALVDSYGGDVSKVAMPELPWAFLSPAGVLELLDLLLRRGYATQDVRGIMGDNFLRVAEAVWK